jgi:hypothetical protein
MKVVFEDQTTMWGKGFNLHDTLSLTVTYKNGKPFIAYETVK